MIVGIQGGLGSGKTVLMTRYLIKDYQLDRNIYANYGLNIIDYSTLKIRDLLDNKVNLQNVSVGIDEFTVFADCRRSMSNTIITYFILQTRKRNVCLYYTTQDFSMMDKRILRHTNLFVTAEDTTNDDFKKYIVVDVRKRKEYIAEFILNIEPFYKFYDTNEIIIPLELQPSKVLKMEDIIP